MFWKNLIFGKMYKYSFHLRENYKFIGQSNRIKCLRTINRKELYTYIQVHSFERHIATFHLTV